MKVLEEFMPLYEYTCLTCDKKFDMLRSYKDADSPIACVSCLSIDTKRRFQHFSPIHLEEVLQFRHQHLQAVDVAAVVADYADPVIININ